jgi:iron complex outermembrane receptor protein
MAQHRINAASGEQETPGYFLAHARGGYTLPWLANSLSLQAGVENLFDAAYREHLDWGSVLRPGRNVYAQLKWVF